ncbi:MAG: GNAT family N-acetyltransferase [Bryobacter sp.]|jgi:RimJ/RimL family protein N-acetyltransferase|nr:GNAT family N-acetyltransferase [Bryobacter sp.]
MNLSPCRLEGRHVRLEPLANTHLNGLAEVGLDPVIWQWMTVRVATREEMIAYIGKAIAAQKQKTELPWVTVLKETGQVVGSTRYMNIAPEHRRLEIGGTWIAPAWQRTVVNTEAKYLQLRHAFEGLHCLRVEFKTDVLNEKSRTAILRLGAKEEGVLRSHMIMPDGRVRDTVYYSITGPEWPGVRAELEARLRKSNPT